MLPTIPTATLLFRVTDTSDSSQPPLQLSVVRSHDKPCRHFFNHDQHPDIDELNISIVSGDVVVDSMVVNTRPRTITPTKKSRPGKFTSVRLKSPLGTLRTTLKFVRTTGVYVGKKLRIDVDVRTKVPPTVPTVSSER